jgi:outer membrane protein assembly factor BamB
MTDLVRCAAVLAGAALVLAPSADPGRSRDRRPPTAPTISGPQETKTRTPVFRLAARDNLTPAARLRYLCTFDSQPVTACSRRTSRRLALGAHRLRAVAVDAAGNQSKTTQFFFAVLPADAEGRVIALDEATGSVRWQMRPPMTIGEVQAGAGRVLLEGGYNCNLPKGRIVSLDAATGAIAWKRELSPGLCGVGGWVGDGAGVVFARDGAAVTGLDAATGKALWRRSGNAGIGGYTNDAADLALDVEGGRLVARSRSDGAPRWTVTPDRGNGQLVVGPTVDGTYAYVIVWGDTIEIAAYALSDGHLVWRGSPSGARIEGFSFPEGDGSGLAMAVSSATQDGYTIIALDPATGRQLWQSATDDYRSAPLVAAGTVYASAGSSDGGPGRLVALDALTGAVRWELPEATENDPLAVDGGVVFAAGEGRLEAVDAATGGVRWQAPLGKGAFSSVSAAGGVLYAFQIGHLTG